MVLPLTRLFDDPRRSNVRMARFQFESSGLAPDLLRLADVLDSEGVRYVIVGGMAMVLHGTTHVTVDSDLAIATDDVTRAAVARALAPLEPEPSHLPRGQRVVWDERSIRGTVVSLRTSVGDVDLMLTLPGVDSFEGLFDRSVLVESAGRRLRIASIPDLIAMKRVAGRAKDLDHIEELENL